MKSTLNLTREDLLNDLNEGVPVPFIGIYDCFSASLAAKSFGTLFVSGFGFAASHYGLPDIGFIAWPDLLGFVQRLRRILPETHLLVDMDDGYVDIEVARHMACALEKAGAFGIVLEDQQRPRQCGHLGGKRILPLPDYLKKLSAVLEATEKLFVVARTDASDPDEVIERVRAFRKAGCHAVLADGIQELSLLRRIRQMVDCPVGFNQMAGGKSPQATLTSLQALGASLIIYSTPCLFPAQGAIASALQTLLHSDGSLAPFEGTTPQLSNCNALLQGNLKHPAG